MESAINASKLPRRACPSTKPLYNGSVCINCPSGEYYDLKNLSCYRPKLASNVTALNLSGKAVSIGSYSLTNMASNISNSVFPLEPCPAAKPLFNRTHCVNCPPHEYYDLRNFKCISSRLVTNINSLNATNRTVATGHYTLAFIQSQIKSQVLPTKPCPSATPLYNGSQCVACGAKQYYLLETLQCYTPVYSSNVNALTSSGNVVQVGGFTLSSLGSKIAAQPFPTKPCPAATPFLSRGKCISCPAGHYYNLQTRSCYKPKPASNVGALSNSGRTVAVGNHTLSALNHSIVTSPYPTYPCPKAAPLFNGTGCSLCPPSTYYLLNNDTCYTPQLVSNVSAMKASHRVIPYRGVSLANVTANIKKLKFPYTECPELYPLFNGTECVTCPNGTYYLLNNDTCYIPQVFTNVTALNQSKLYINVGNHTLTRI